MGQISISTIPFQRSTQIHKRFPQRKVALSEKRNENFLTKILVQGKMWFNPPPLPHTLWKFNNLDQERLNSTPAAVVDKLSFQNETKNVSFLKNTLATKKFPSSSIPVHRWATKPASDQWTSQQQGGAWKKQTNKFQISKPACRWITNPHSKILWWFYILEWQSFRCWPWTSCLVIPKI